VIGVKVDSMLRGAAVNVAIEMHDSELLSVGFDDAGLGSVLLRAYIHRTPGEPGVSSGDGGVQLVRIALEHMAIALLIGPRGPYAAKSLKGVG
jgi:hypothetical protein